MHSIPDAIQATQQRLRELCASNDIIAALGVFEQEHGVCGKYNGQLVILDYDTIKVKWSEPYGHVCRGLILDPLDNWDVVAFGLPKFFNLGEHHAAPIDWESARAIEKCDGTMVQRYWNPYTGRFEYSTRFQLHDDLARNKCSGLSDMTWLQLIERCLSGRVFQQRTGETYVFEVMSPLNRIVVAQHEFWFRLLAIRETGDPAYPERVVSSNFHPWAPTEIGFNVTAEEVVAIADGFPGTKQEGFVVVDKHFNRVKVKNKNYVHLHRLKDGVNSVGAVIMLARGNDHEEVTTHFPEFTKPIEMAKMAINDFVIKHENCYRILAGLGGTQKDFALRVKDLEAKGWVTTPSLLFSVRAGKHPTIRDAILAMRESTFIDIITKRLPPEFVTMCLLPPGNPPPKAMLDEMRTVEPRYTSSTR